MRSISSSIIVLAGVFALWGAANHAPNNNAGLLTVAVILLGSGFISWLLDKGNTEK